MWPDLRKGVFHTHPVLWVWKTITGLSKMIWSWNFLQPLSYVSASCWSNFKLIAFTNWRLWIIKVSNLDVCGRPLFANPVTYTLLHTANTQCMHFILSRTEHTCMLSYYIMDACRFAFSCDPFQFLLVQRYGLEHQNILCNNRILVL